MTKHTPGPWHVHTAKYRRHYAIGDVEVSTREGTGVICTLYAENWSGTDGQDAANARLIAAAPDLLEAAELVETLLQNGLQVDRQSIPTTLRNAIRETIGHLAAAIAKAKGEAS